VVKARKRMKLCGQFRSVLILSYRKNLCLDAVLEAAPKITQDLPEESCAASCRLSIEPAAPGAGACSSAPCVLLVRIWKGKRWREACSEVRKPQTISYLEILK